MSMSDERKTQDNRLHGEPDEGTARPAELGPSQSGTGAVTAGECSSHGEATTSATSRPSAKKFTTVEAGERPESKPPTGSSGVYFFPDETVTDPQVRRLLASDSPGDRAKVVSHLLAYADYDEIWTWVDRDTVRELFDRLDLPERLRSAWGRNLGLVAKAD